MFGLFKKKQPAAALTDAAADEPPEPLGWRAIEDAFENLYPNQTPVHIAHNGVMAMDDLRRPPENPLDGISIYDAGAFWHYVGFGLTELYAKSSSAPQTSGCGYELTARVRKTENSRPP